MSHQRRIAILASHLCEAAPQGAGPLSLQPTCGGTHAGDWSYAVKRDFDPAVAAPWAYQKQVAPSRPAKQQPISVDMPVPHL